MAEGEKKEFETKEETETKEGETEEKSETKEGEIEEKSEIKDDGDETKEPTEKKADEVFEVDDDGKDFESTKITPDEEYFATVATEEVEWYKEHVPDHNKKVQCTSCFKQVRKKVTFGPNHLKPHFFLKTVNHLHLWFSTWVH